MSSPPNPAPLPNVLPEHTLDHTIDERAGHCFGCGPTNPQGLHLHFTIDTTNFESPVVTARVQLTELHQGPPGHIHGGILATLLDEAMSKLNRPLGLLAVTRNLQVDYLHPSPLHQPLVLVGTHVRREGRKIFHQAELRNAEGKVLVRGQGLFIVLEERHLPQSYLNRP